MPLAFPNQMRSFDSTVNCVRFCGHDTAIEVSFFMEVNALAKLCPELIQQEPEILIAFDAQIIKIHKAAIDAYQKNKGKYVCTLSANNF